MFSFRLELALVMRTSRNMEISSKSMSSPSQNLITALTQLMHLITGLNRSKSGRSNVLTWAFHQSIEQQLALSIPTREYLSGSPDSCVSEMTKTQRMRLVQDKLPSCIRARSRSRPARMWMKKKRKGFTEVLNASTDYVLSSLDLSWP